MVKMYGTDVRPKRQNIKLKISIVVDQFLDMSTFAAKFARSLCPHDERMIFYADTLDGPVECRTTIARPLQNSIEKNFPFLNKHSLPYKYKCCGRVVIIA